MPITRVKPAASSSTKKAVTKKAKTANSGALPKAIAAEKDYQNVDKKVVDIKKSVNSQVLMRGAASAIKKLGANPIALIRTYSVKRGPLVFTPSGVHKKQVSSRKEGRAALNREIAKAEGFRPSELKIAQAVAARKISVNAEVIIINIDHQKTIFERIENQVFSS